MEFAQRVEVMSVKELDVFWSFVDYDPDAGMEEATTHLMWRGKDFALKKKRTGEQTPMHWLDGRLYSAQRIALILFTGVDPLRKRRIRTLCGFAACVNPYHQRIKPPKQKEDKPK